MKRVVSIVSVFVCAVLVAAPARAQEVRVQELIAEIQRIVNSAVGPEIAQEITKAMRDVSRDINREVIRNVADIHVTGAGFQQSKDFKAEQIDRQTKTLAIGAAGELVLKNVVGDITVKAGGSKDATVEIVRTSRGKTDADAKTGLEKVTTEVVSKGERATISVNYPNEHKPPYAVSVAYNVTAPPGTRLSIDTITGDVRVTGIKGDLNTFGVSGITDVSNCDHVVSVRTISGDITLTDAANPAKLEVGSISGGVTLKNIRADRLEAGAVAAEIVAHEIRANTATLKTMSGDITYSGSLDARGRYEFRAHSGDIRLGVTGGFELDASTFSGDVQAESGLGITAGTNKRALRGTAGSGGAAVVISTFSGSVWVGRKIK